MQLGMIGLGRMGANMVQRLLEGGHTIAAFDRSPDAVKESAARGAVGCASLGDLVKALKPPRAAWVMVPSGAPTNDTIAQLATLLEKGDVAVCKRLEPIFLTLAPKDGYLRVGPVGAGHFVKMVHNGIEYGMMEAYGEGFEVMRASEFGDKLDMRGISHLWNQGSVIRSWLLELAELAFSSDRDLAQI